MKDFTGHFRAYLQLLADCFSHCYAVYSRERLFETAPKAVMKLLMSIINNVNMVTTDARRYMSCLFDVVEEDVVKYSVPCAELVRFMEALQVVASVVGDA